MDKKIYETTQKRVMDLLLSLSDDLHIAAEGQCSEVARLVGCWILSEHPEYKIQIFKGALSDGMAHDILVVSKDGLLSLVDPTVWQIFPDSKSIFIGTFQNVSGAINLLEKKYSGSWKISESMETCDEGYQQELLEVIKKSGQEK